MEDNKKIVNFDECKLNNRNFDDMTVGELKIFVQQVANGDIIIPSCVQDIIEMNKRNALLAKHPYKIWHGKDGKWRTYILNKDGKRVLKKRRTEKEIQDIVIEHYKNLENARKKDYSFKSFFKCWEQKQISYGVSNNTVTKYNSDYMRYFEGTNFEKLDIRNINEEDITAFVIQCIKKLGLKEKAGKALMGYISGVFKHARIARVIIENPCEYVETRKFVKFYDKSQKSIEQRTINSTDLNLLLQQLHISQEQKPSYIPSYAVELAIYTGMRVGEITALKWEDIREDLGIIHIRRSEKFDRITREYMIESTKTGKERQFPISDKLSNLLKNIRKIELQYGFMGEYVFQNEGGKLHATSVTHCIRYKCIQAGIPVKSIHALRRTLNSKLRCAGVSSVVAASLMGHTEEVNSTNYTYDISDMEYKRKIVSNII